MSRASAALVLALLVGACALPGTVGTRAFSTGFKSGQTYRYQAHVVLSGTLSLSGQQLPLSSDQKVNQTIRVKSVDRSGAATLEISFADVIAGGSGATTTVRAAPLTIRIGADGRILAGSGSPVGGRAPSIPGSDQLTPVFPDHPVRPGDSWDKRYSRPNPFGSGGFELTSHSTYLRDERVGGADAAVIDTTLRGPIDFTIDFSKLPQPAGSGLGSGSIHYLGRVASTTRYWIDLSSHLVLKASGKGTYTLNYGAATPPGQAAGPQQVSFDGQIRTDLTRI